ncbi:MAG: hypothetical protein AB2689_02110 [Candidatus Thiodiazotropha taylori]
MPSEDNKLLEVLNGEDELGAVIRAHIHIEARINKLIESNIRVPKHLGKLDLEYHQKVKLAIACGLNSDFESPLNTLGTLRNNFAHKLDTSLSVNEVQSLYNSFKGIDKQIIQGAYQRTKKKMSIKGPKSVTKLEPKEQFILIVISLDAALQSETKRLSNESCA